MRCRVPVFVTIVCMATVVLAGSSAIALRSAWRDVEITVDGSHAEWSELTSFAKDVPFSIGMKNDGTSLFVVLSSSDQSVPPLLMQRGLIVWFDPAGGTRKRFGIKYPVIEGGGVPGPRRPGGFGGAPGTQPGDQSGQGSQRPPGAEGPPPEPSGLMFDPAKDGRWARLELLGPGKDDRRSLILEATPGIEVRVGRVEGSVVYELKVPLQVDDGHPFAVGARPGAKIGIGLETPEAEKAENPGDMGKPGGRPPGGGGAGGRPPGGGMGGGGTGGLPPMGGGGPRGGPGGFEPPKPIKAWATAQLASAPPS
jgi:hypothetical protein